jgi:hypothetical protein
MKVRHLGYERVKPVFGWFQMDAPENPKEFDKFMSTTANQELVDAVCERIQELSEIGKPSITMYGCQPVGFAVDEIIERLLEVADVRTPLQIDEIRSTEYAIVAAEVVGESLYVTVNFTGPEEMYSSWEGPQTIARVNQMVIRFQPDGYYVAVIRRDRYSDEITRDIGRRFGLPVAHEMVRSHKRWFTNVINQLPDATVRSMAGALNGRVAKTFSIGAGAQPEDIRLATGNKIDDIDLVVEGNQTTGDVRVLRVTVTVAGAPITFALNLKHNHIVIYNFMDMALLEAVMLVLKQVLLAEGAA